MQSLVTAVVPTYRPEAHSLIALVEQLAAAGCRIVVADDASPATFDPALRQAGAAGATVVRHRDNAGIARSLNAGLANSRDHRSPWLLTVDQDSSVPEGYVSGILSAAQSAADLLGRDRVGAVAAGTIGDASGELGYPVEEADGVLTTAEVIQTGTLWSVDGLTDIGGFDEAFGIDAVDAAACVRLRHSGRVIVVVPDLTIQHRIGDGRQVSLLGRTVMATGHSPERRTSIVRNRLRLAPEEFRESPLQAWRSLRRVLVSTALAVTVEDNRWAKAKASARGLFPRRDG